MLINILVLFSLLMLYAFYQSRFERFQCIDLIFFAMWICFAVEYYATTDYPVYYENFDRTYIHVIWEPGYRLLLYIFQPFGFHIFNAAVAAFEMYTLCFMFKRFCPPRYVWIGILIFMLDVDNMLGYMCLKRQFFAMAISLWTLYFTCWSTDRRRWLYALLTFLASISIHTTAVVSVAYFIVPFIRFRLGWIAGGLIALLFLWSLTFDITDYIDQLFDFYNIVEGDNISSGRYGQYVEELGEGITGNVLSKVGLFIAVTYVMGFAVMILFNRRVTLPQYRLLLLSLANFIFGNILIGDLYRLNHYFTITTFFTIPIMVDRLFSTASVATRRADTIGAGGRAFIRTAAAYLCLLLWIAGPAKSYFNAFTGTKVSYMTCRFKHFPTIFDESVDKSVYKFDNTREVE